MTSSFGFDRWSFMGVFLLTVSACSSDEKDDSLHLALIPKAGNNIVFDIGRDGAEFAARVLNEDEQRKVEITYMAPSALDPAEQRRVIREAIDRKMDGLIVSCVDDSISEPIDEAVAAGIPVITYDSDCSGSDRLGFYSMVSEDTGLKAAELLAEAMGPGPREIVILNGREGADNLERRAAAFEERLADMYPDVTVLETVHCDESAEGCGQAIEEDIIEQYPDLDGLFVVGLWGLLEACSCSESGLTCLCEDTQMPKWKSASKGGLKTVAYDTLPFELQLLKQGHISALIGQKYFAWGYESVNLMVDHLTEGKNIEEFVDSGFDVVCPNNADAMLDNWSSADFTQELEPCEL